MVESVSHTTPSSWCAPPQHSSNHSNNSSNNLSLDLQHQDELLDIARSPAEKTETKQSAEEEMNRAGAGDERDMDGLSDPMPSDYGGSSSETLPAGDPGHTGLRRRSHYEGQEEEPGSRARLRRMSSRRTFFVDDGQAGSRTEAAAEGYSHRADLERMVSRRAFPVQADMDGHQAQPGHQARRSSMATAARRRSSVASARSPGENQVAGAADTTSLHADNMVRNKDTSRAGVYLLRRAYKSHCTRPRRSFR